MKLKQMLFWQGKTSLTAFITFYLILVLVSILGGILAMTYPEEVTFQMVAISATVIFLFVIGLSSFSGNLRFGCAIGISRRTHFLSFLLFAIIIAAITALLSILIDAIPYLFGVNYYDIGLESSYNPFLLFFPLNLFVISLGYLISGVYYRLNKTGKVLVSILVPVGIIVLLVNVTTSSPNTVFYPIQQFSIELSSWITNRQNAFLFFSLISVIFLLFGWLVTRRAPIKQQSSVNA